MTKLPLWHLPDLIQTLSNTARILPLMGLIEFVDSVTSLHIFELSGLQPMWSWAITPRCAHALLEEQMNGMIKSCYLDLKGKNPALLNCIDSRWGDLYSCTSAHTVRMCAAAAARVNGGVRITSQRKIAIENPDKQKESWNRPIRLTVIRVQLIDPSPSYKCALVPWRFIIISGVGWMLWFGITFVSFMTHRWYAMAWMISVVLSGLMLKYTHGKPPCKLYNTGNEDDQRLMLTTDSDNALQWTAYIGGHNLLDSLLRKPFVKYSAIERRWQTKTALRILRVSILAQWALIVIASGSADWNSIFITLWLVIGYLKSTFIYTSKHAIRDWLRSNNIRLSCCEVEMRNRWVMLPALVALNPDSFRLREGGANGEKWILHVVSHRKRSEDELYQGLFAKTSERHAEAAIKETLYSDLLGMNLLSSIEEGTLNSNYWLSLIQETREVVKFVRESLHLPPDDIHGVSAGDAFRILALALPRQESVGK